MVGGGAGEEGGGTKLPILVVRVCARGRVSCRSIIDHRSGSVRVVIGWALRGVGISISFLRELIFCKYSVVRCGAYRLRRYRYTVCAYR